MQACTCAPLTQSAVWLQEQHCILQALKALAGFLQQREDIWPKAFGNISTYIERVLSLQVCVNIAQVRGPACTFQRLSPAKVVLRVCAPRGDHPCALCTQRPCLALL